MLRKLLLWSHRNRQSQKSHNNARRPRTVRTLRDTNLGMECLESRSMLSDTPDVFIELDQFFGAGLVSEDILFRVTFTDELQEAGEDLVYEYNIDFDHPDFDIPDISGFISDSPTSNFQVQKPFWRSEQAGDLILGQLTVAPDFSSLAGSVDTETIGVTVTINESFPAIADFNVYPVDDLSIGDENDPEEPAFEGIGYTLSLPTTLSDDVTAIDSWLINWGDAVTSNATHAYSDDLNITTTAPDYIITAVADTANGRFYSIGRFTLTVEDSPAVTTISVTVEDEEETEEVSVNVGEEFTLNLSSIDDPGDPAQKWEIHWEGLENPAEEIFGNPTSVTHTYTTDGARNIVAIAINDDQIESQSNTLTVTVNDDEPEDGVFLVDGTLSVIDTNAANDLVTVTQSGTSISVTIGGNTTGFAAGDVDEIEVVLGSGQDVVVIGSNITVPVAIDGGDGNDFLAGGGGPSTLIGGNGHDILWGAAGDDILLGGSGNDDLFGGGGNDAIVGGTGNDIVTGGVGRDLLIGSQNSDLLVGGNGEDILIGGWTDHDNNIAALDNIMCIWGSTEDDFDARVAELTENGGLLQAGAVFDDGALDVIFGGAGRDLVFGDTNPAGNGVVDLLVLNAIQDELIAIG
jgi:Ca2+-binding RTX toxin-like protein